MQKPFRHEKQHVSWQKGRPGSSNDGCAGNHRVCTDTGDGRVSQHERSILIGRFRDAKKHWGHGKAMLQR